MTRRKYRINGMDCANEIEALKRTVGRVPGVVGMDFNLLDGTMEVTVSGVELDDATILGAVKSVGMDAVPWSGESCSSNLSIAGASYWQKNGRAVLCCASGVLVLLGFVSDWVLHGSFIHALAEGNTGISHRFPLISVIFYLGAIATGGWFVGPKALAAARRFRPDMNLLMTIAVTGAVVIGEWLEAATVASLFALSLLLESWSVARARRAIRSLLNLAPATARYVLPGDGNVVERPIAEVPVGVIVVVRPGERIPLDGLVTRGSTTVNQAPISGESLPVSKQPDDEVFAGSINETGAIEFRVTRPASDTTLSRIIRMVEEAQSRRAPLEQWVDKFARYYTPAMILVALLFAVVPPVVFGGGWSPWFYEALVILVIACPCALVISTPITVVAALTSAAREGVLIKGGAFLEAAARVRVVAIDKTGTVTHGLPEVQQITPLNNHTETELLERAAALEVNSDHPLARAILRYAKARNIIPQPAEAFRVLRGRGAEGFIGGRRFWLGSHRFLHESGAETSAVHHSIEAMEDAGHSVVVIGNDEHVCGLISVADTIRKEARAAIRQLKNVGVARVVMLTGDNDGTAQAVALAIGVDEVRAELLPEDKLRAVEELVNSVGPTAMIGDGINDAPALAAATLGIAMGAAGTDAAIETADIALMSDDLVRIPWLFRHAQRTLRVIRQNIGFALLVKLIFMSLALAKVATLWMAIAADMGASLLVIVNGLRLLDGHARGVST